MENILKIHRTVFPVERAVFRYCPQSGHQPYNGWDFNIECGENPDLTARHNLYGRTPRLYAERDPIPLANKDDLTGTTLILPDAWNSEYNEPYFTLYVFEHGDLFNTKLQFIEKQGNAYRIHLSARIPAGSVYGSETRLDLQTWMERLPDGE